MFDRFTRVRRLALVLTIGLITSVVAVSLASCAEQSEPVQPAAWTENEAIAHLAEQLYQDALAEIEAMGEAGQRLIANGYFPSKRATGDWVATKDEDGSWLVDTGVRLHRLFESGAPFVLIEVHPTPIPNTLSPKVTVNTPVRIGIGGYYSSSGRIVNCLLADESPGLVLGRGTTAHIIETKYECIPPFIQIQLEDGSKYWVKLNDLVIDQ